MPFKDNPIRERVKDKQILDNMVDHDVEVLALIIFT